MPVGKQGNVGPAIARFIAVDRAGVCFRASAGWKPAGLLPFPVADGIAYPDAAGNLVLWGTLASVNGAFNLKPIHYNVTNGAVSTGPDFPLGFANSPVVSVQIADGRIFTRSSSSNALYAYDVNAKTWTAKALTPSIRTSGDCMIDMQNGTIVNMGGLVAGVPSTAVDVYTIATDTWATDAAVLPLGGESPSFTAGLLLSGGQAFMTWPDFATQDTITWTPGVATLSTNFIPRKLPVNFSNRKAQCQIQAFKTGDGFILMPANPTNATILPVIKFTAAGAGVIQVNVPLPLIYAVGTTRAFDGASLLWEAYPAQTGGNNSVGFVTYLNGVFSTVQNIPSDRHLQVMAGNPGAAQWFSFGGAVDGDTQGTRDIYVINA